MPHGYSLSRCIPNTVELTPHRRQGNRDEVCLPPYLGYVRDTGLCRARHKRVISGHKNIAKDFGVGKTIACTVIQGAFTHDPPRYVQK